MKAHSRESKQVYVLVCPVKKMKHEGTEHMQTGIPLEPEKSSGDLNIHSSGVAHVWICGLEVELLQIGYGLKGKAGEEASCS